MIETVIVIITIFAGIVSFMLIKNSLEKNNQYTFEEMFEEKEDVI